MEPESSTNLLTPQYADRRAAPRKQSVTKEYAFMLKKLSVYFDPDLHRVRKV
jgi:hypothetical protein